MMIGPLLTTTWLAMSSLPGFTLAPSLHFQDGGVRPSPEGTQVLDAVASDYAARTGSWCVVRIQGHADDWDAEAPRTEALNQRLSEKRALMVRDLLTQRGVPAELVVTEGFGTQVPRVRHAYSEGEKWQNRRVDIVISTYAEPGLDGACPPPPAPFEPVP